MSDMNADDLKELLDEYVKRLREHKPGADKVHEEILRKSLTTLLSNFDIQSFHEVAEKEFDLIDKRLTANALENMAEAINSQDSIAAPGQQDSGQNQRDDNKPKTMCMIFASVDDTDEESDGEDIQPSTSTRPLVGNEVVPMLMDLAADTMADGNAQDTMYLIYEYLFRKLQPMLTNKLTNMLGAFVFPQLTGTPELEDLAKFFLKRLQKIVPDYIYGRLRGDQKKDRVKAAKDFAAIIDSCLTNSSSQGLQFDKDELTKATYSLLKLTSILQKAIFNIMMGDENPKKLLFPALKELFRFLSAATPRETSE